MKQHTVWSRLLAGLMAVMMLAGVLTASALAVEQANYSMRNTTVTTRETPEQLPDSNNLNHFVASVTSDWPTDGKLYAGVKYSLHMDFAEVVGHQFGSEKPYEFYYTFPEGVKPVDLVTGTQRVKKTYTVKRDDNTTYSIDVWMNYKITGNQLKVTFDDDPATWDYLNLFNDSTISVDAWIQYDETSKLDKIVCIEVEKEIYEVMNRFELDDLSYLNEMDNHYERSELTEAALTKRAQKKAESVDALVLEKLQNENLKETVLRLPEIQRRRVVLYYYGGFTCKQIAEQENCSVIAVKKTLDAARKNLKKLLE